MKQIITFMVAGVLAISLSGCGGEAPKQQDLKAQEASLPSQAQEGSSSSTTVAPN